MEKVENKNNPTESPDKNLEQWVDHRLEDYEPIIRDLLVLRHELFDVKDTEYSKDLNVEDQLYDFPEYNAKFIRHDLGLRLGNVLPYQQLLEKYDKGADQESDLYRQAIMHAGQKLGFVASEPSIASSPIDMAIGITDSELKPIDEPIAAVVINGAAGMSNIIRVRDAIRNIELGKIKTSKLILSGGLRVVDDAEKGRVIEPFQAGDTEAESLQKAAEQLLGISFEEEARDIDVPYGDNLSAEVRSSKAIIGGKEVEIDVVYSPFDTNRTMDDGSPAKRINTEETFLATLPLTDNIPGGIVMQSHDTWTPWQEIIGKQVWSLGEGRNVYAAGPFRADRIFWTEDENGKKSMDINKPQEVIDEIVKVYKQLLDFKLQSVNSKHKRYI